MIKLSIQLMEYLDRLHSSLAVTDDHGPHPGPLIIPRHATRHFPAALVRAVTKTSTLRILQVIPGISHLHQKFAKRLHDPVGWWDSAMDEEDSRGGRASQGFLDIGFRNHPGVEGENSFLQFA